MIIENSFDVDADPGRVFEFLQDPHNVATCFPGAELTEDLGDDQYKGKVKIKLGPVTAAFAGIARITEKDDVARIAVLVAEGKDARGSGTAKATATMRVEPTETGSSVLLKTDLTISGKLAQFGRGIMADVSTRMVNDLAKRVQERIESESEAAEAAAGVETGTAASTEAGAETGTAASTEATTTAGAVADTGAETASGDGTASADGTASGDGAVSGDETASGDGAVSGDGATTEAATSAAGSATDSGAVSGATADTPTNTASETATAPAAAAATAKTSARPSGRPSEPAESAGAIKASTLLKVMVTGMFRRLFARLRGRGAENRNS